MTRQKKHKADYEHEINLKILDVMAKDPTAKYFIGASLGLGAAWATNLFSQYTTAEETGPTPIQTGVNWYETLLGVGSPLLSASGIFDFNKDGEGGLAGNIFAFATGSYAAFCMACCILSASSGNKTGSPLGPLAGVL